MRIFLLAVFVATVLITVSRFLNTEREVAQDNQDKHVIIEALPTDPHIVRVSGYLEAESAEFLDDFIKHHPDVKYLMLEIKEGVFNAALEVVDLVEAHDLTVLSYFGCQGVCVPIFVLAAKRGLGEDTDIYPHDAVNFFREIDLPIEELRSKIHAMLVSAGWPDDVIEKSMNPNDRFAQPSSVSAKEMMAADLIHYVIESNLGSPAYKQALTAAAKDFENDNHMQSEAVSDLLTIATGPRWTALTIPHYGRIRADASWSTVANNLQIMADFNHRFPEEHKETIRYISRHFMSGGTMEDALKYWADDFIEELGDRYLIYGAAPEIEEYIGAFRILLEGIRRLAPQSCRAQQAESTSLRARRKLNEEVGLQLFLAKMRAIATAGYTHSAAGNDPVAAGALLRKAIDNAVSLDTAVPIALNPVDHMPVESGQAACDYILSVLDQIDKFQPEQRDAVRRAFILWYDGKLF